MKLQVCGSGSHWSGIHDRHVGCDRCGEASLRATKAQQAGQVCRNAAGMPEGQPLPDFSPSKTTVGHSVFQAKQCQIRRSQH